MIVIVLNKPKGKEMLKMKGEKNVKNFCQAEPRKNLYTGSFFLSFLSTMFVVSGAFATGVSSGATTANCDKPTLNTYTGTSNLQAGWRPNPIALHWYDGDTELTVAEESQSCIYDSTLTPPPAPTKTGYTFKGWRVRQICSFTASGVNGMSYVTHGHARLNGNAGEKEAQYGLTTPGEWAVEFRTGIIKGMAKCSNTDGGSMGTLGTPSDTNGSQCWCRATNYTPNGGNQCNVASPSWVYNTELIEADRCADICADRCASNVRIYTNVRRAVFGVQ